MASPIPAARLLPCQGGLTIWPDRLDLLSAREAGRMIAALRAIDEGAVAP